MINKLRLPEHVSPDGREIWDWAAKLGRHTALLQKQRDILGQIASVENRCGSCVRWMTNVCPRETRTKTGRRSGPSMNGVACSQFVVTQSSAKLLEQWRAELDEVKRKLEDHPNA